MGIPNSRGSEFFKFKTWPPSLGNRFSHRNAGEMMETGPSSPGLTLGSCSCCHGRVWPGGSKGWHTLWHFVTAGASPRGRSVAGSGCTPECLRNVSCCPPTRGLDSSPETQAALTPAHTCVLSCHSPARNGRREGRCWAWVGPSPSKRTQLD